MLLCLWNLLSNFLETFNLENKDLLKKTCTNTIITSNLINHGWLKIQKLEYLENRVHIFHKKICNLSLRWPIFRSYFFSEGNLYIIMKNSFHLKNCFCSQDIQIFIFLPSLFSLLASFRGRLKINFKAFMMSPNKNLMPHFVWYLEKEKRYDIETWSVWWGFK